MELLGRALLLGCLLPGLWLIRLTPLEPLVTIVPVEATALGSSLAEPPLVASGAGWSSLLKDIDALAADSEPPDLRWRMSSEAPRDGSKVRSIFFKADDEPMIALRDRLAPRGRIVLVNPAGDRFYRLDQRTFTRADFQPPSGFRGSPPPPSSILYPFQVVGIVVILVGFGLFLLLPRDTGGPSVLQVGLLVAAAVLFAGPLFLVGGSVQALVRWPWLTLPCWAAGAVAMHFFASPRQNAQLLLLQTKGDTSAPPATPQSTAFARIGLAFLAIAVGPATVLVASSLALWNR